LSETYEIKDKIELADWLSKTPMHEDSTEFKELSPAADTILLPHILPEANLEMWRLLTKNYFAGTYNEYERTLLSFQLVRGWPDFYNAYTSGHITLIFVSAEPDQATMALGYFDEAAMEERIFEFNALKVTTLPSVEIMNQPQLSREVVVFLDSNTMFSASDLVNLFAEAGYDLVWRVFADGEKSPHLVEMNTGHFFQFRHSLESDHSGMMTECKQRDDGVVLYFSIWSKEADMFKRAIADLALRLDVRGIISGNCVLTSEQYSRVIEEGAHCLSEIYPSREAELR